MVKLKTCMGHCTKQNQTSGCKFYITFVLVPNFLLLSWTHQGPQIFYAVKFSRFLVRDISYFRAIETTSYRWDLKICLFSLLVRYCISKPKNLFHNLRTFAFKNFKDFNGNNRDMAISLRIQSECGKIRTRKNPVFGHISRSARNLFSTWYAL